MALTTPETELSRPQRLGDSAGPDHARRSRTQPRPAGAAEPEDAALRRRPERRRAGAAPRAQLLRRRAGARLPEVRSGRWRSSAAPWSAARRIATASPTPAGSARRCSSRRTSTSGVAPVPFEQYRRYMLNFQTATPQQRDARSRARGVRRTWCISQHVLDQLGPAINAGHSMFVYGPPGNGKTVISQAIRKLLRRRHRRSRTPSRSRAQSSGSSTR